MYGSHIRHHHGLASGNCEFPRDNGNSKEELEWERAVTIYSTGGEGTANFLLPEGILSVCWFTGQIYLSGMAQYAIEGAISKIWVTAVVKLSKAKARKLWS